MLLRKHLLSATLLNIELIGFDRIVRIDFMPSAEFFDPVKKSLYVELMGRYSNVILTENGKILGGNRGINMFDNGVRPLIVGQPYVFPPVNDKRLPNDSENISIFDKVRKDDLASLICKNVQGIAPATANEIVFTYFSNRIEDVTNGNLFFDTLNDYLFNNESRPCVIFSNGEIKDVCVYPYITVLGDIKHFDTLIDAEEYYFTEREKVKQFKMKKERLTSIVNTAIKKVKKKLVAIKSKQKDALDCEENRIKGELLLANIYRIKTGQSKVVLENYYDGTKVDISLDERLSVAKNAESYYKKYNKQKRTLSALEPQLVQAESELSYFISISDEISLCETIDELLVVQSELVLAGLMVEQKNNSKKKKIQESFCREYEINGFKVRVGRNNTENDKLTFTAKPHDIWVHAKDYHSSHVVIETQGKSVPDNVIYIVAEICAYYSKGRDGGKTEISYTEKKNVKKPPRSKLVFVVYENYRSITVKPDNHLCLLIKEKE